VAGPGEVDTGPGVPGGAGGLDALCVGAGVLGVLVSAGGAKLTVSKLMKLAGFSLLSFSQIFLK